MGVHERLTAGKADLFDRQAMVADLGAIGREVFGQKPAKAVVAGRRFDIAARTGQVTKRASIDPQCPQMINRYHRPRLTIGGPIRVSKFSRRHGLVSHGRAFTLGR
jgi:hypothetical protein